MKMNATILIPLFLAGLTLGRISKVESQAAGPVPHSH